MSEQVRFDARSELQKERFRDICDELELTMTDVFLGVMDEMIEQHSVGDDPDGLELQAIELEQEAEEHTAAARELETKRENVLTAAEDVRRKASRLRKEANELRAASSSYEDDLKELFTWARDNPGKKLFPGHRMVSDLADTHEKTDEDIIDSLRDLGLHDTQIGDAL